MQPDGIGEVIAERTLYLDEEGHRHEIAVRIGKPILTPDPTPSYSVPYEIVGPELNRSFYACGVDAVQALQLVMKMIAADLTALSSTYPGGIRWECESVAGDFGFPE